MTELMKETITTNTTEENNINPVVEKTTNRDATNFQTIEYLTYFMFGILEVLLIFRFILKFMGASNSSLFINSTYSVTSIFILPFEGIFRKVFTKGIETTSVVEPSTLIAIIVYAVLGLGLVKLIRILSGKKQSSI